MNNENHNTGMTGTSSIGGMASSLMPDTEQSTSLDSEKQGSHPLLSVLRRENGPATLQFESTSGLLDDLEDSDEDMPRTGEKRSGRRKIKIEYIEDKSRRHITFSKRKAGIMKKVNKITFNCLIFLGVRIEHFDWNSGIVTGRFRDRPRVHICHPQTPTTNHQARRKKFNPGVSQFTRQYASNHSIPVCYCSSSSPRDGF